MNKNILKLIKAELKDDFKQRGFKTEGQWYMRLVNSQIYQTIFIQGSSFGNEFCVNISLIPICYNNVFVRHSGSPFRLGVLAYGYDYWWNYSVDSVKDVTSLMRKTTFPIFDDCTTYRRLFEAVKPIIGKAEESVQNNLTAKIFHQIDNISWARLLISLNEYEYCKILLNNTIRCFTDAIEYDREFEEAKAGTNDPKEIQRLERIIEKRKKDFTEWIDKFKPYLAMVESGNLSEFIEETKENERKSLEVLKKYIVNIRNDKKSEL